MYGVKITLVNETPYSIKARLGTSNFFGKDKHFGNASKRDNHWIMSGKAWSVSNWNRKGISIYELYWPKGPKPFVKQIGLHVKLGGRNRDFTWTLENEGIAKKQGVYFINLRLRGTLAEYTDDWNPDAFNPKHDLTKVDKQISIPINKDQRDNILRKGPYQ